MERNDFDAAAAALIRRNWRHMDDLGGQPPAALLDGLWGIVQAHAEDAGVIAVKREDDAPGKPEGVIYVDGTLQGTPTPPKPAPRRTTRRSTPK